MIDINLLSQSILQRILENLKEGTIIQRPREIITIKEVCQNYIKYEMATENSTKEIVPMELLRFIKELINNRKVTRQWFNKEMPQSAYNDPCNFTAMGSILEHFKYANYADSGVYECNQGNVSKPSQDINEMAKELLKMFDK